MAIVESCKIVDSYFTDLDNTIVKMNYLFNKNKGFDLSPSIAKHLIFLNQRA